MEKTRMSLSDWLGQAGIWLVLILTISVFLGYGINAYACGVIMPQPPQTTTDLGQPTAPLPVKHATLDISIEDQVARITVDEAFYNPHNTRLEGVFLLPIPAEAGVSNLALWINGQEQKGELLDRDRAWQVYGDIVRVRRDPAFLEYAGSQLLRLRIFPIEPQKETRVKYAYTCRLTSDSGLNMLRHAWGTNKFSPTELEQIVIKATVKSTIPLKTIYSPTYPALDIVRKDDHTATITLEQSKVKPDKDFILYYTVSEKDFGINLVTYRKTGEDGYFMMMIAPKYTNDYTDRVKKDVVFMLDTSGSMVGEKIKQAKDALIYCIKSLSEDDRFNLITFSGEARSFKPALQEVTASTKEAALKFIDAIEARGGTNIDEALQMALGMQDTKSGRPFLTVFMTDGLPTIGEQNPETILKSVQAKNANNTRIFTFGVGHDVNVQLLDRIAETTRGAREYIAPQDNIEVKVSNFYDKIAYPVLANVMLNVDGVEVYDRYPKQLPDLFRGSQLVLLGRYKGEGNKLITLAGAVNDKPRKLEYEATFASTNETTDFIPVLWATSKIGYLLDEIRLHGETKEVKDEIVKLSKEFGIMTPYTAWLVTEDVRAQAQRSGRMQEGLQQFAGRVAKDGDLQDKMKLEENALAAEPRAPGAVGKDAINMSRRADELQKGQYGGADKKATQAIHQQMKQQADKTFYQDAKGIWYDAAYDVKDETKITQIKFMSDEYLNLIKKQPRLAKYFAVGQQVIVCWSDKIYQITE